MAKVPLGQVLIEQCGTVGKRDGDGLSLIGVDNKIGLHLSRQARLPNLSRYKLLKKGWFAYNPMRINVGSIGYADSDEKVGIISPDYVVFSCSELIHPEYFFHFIKSDIGLLEISKNTGGSVRERLYFHKLSNIEIELPGYSDQEKIVASLNKKRELLNILTRENQFLKKDTQYLRDCILQNAVRGRLTKQDPADEPANKLLERIKAEKQQLIADGKLKKEKPLPPITAEEIPFELPEGWVWCRLGDLAEVGTGATPLTSRKDYYSGNIAWVTSSATGLPFVSEAEKYISEKAIAETNCKIYPIGTLIVAMYGQGKTRGQISELLIESATNQACAAIELVSKSISHKKYVKYYFQKIYDEIRKLSAGGAQPNLNLQKVRETLIPISPPTEEERIVAKVQRLMQNIDLLEEQVQQSQTQAQLLFQAVLREAFESAQLLRFTFT